MAEIDIRPATSKDVAAICSKPISSSFRGYTLTLDGEPVGIAGVMLKEDRGILFGEAKEAARAYPWAIYKGVRRVMKLVERAAMPVVAVADPNIPRSEELLVHLGFWHVDTCQYGEVYRWNQE
jgi:hypothetical protein